ANQARMDHVGISVAHARPDWARISYLHLRLALNELVLVGEHLLSRNLLAVVAELRAADALQRLERLHLTSSTRWPLRRRCNWPSSARGGGPVGYTSFVLTGAFMSVFAVYRASPSLAG